MSLFQLFITKRHPRVRAKVRTVESDFTPKRGMFFLTLDDAVQFYNIYALACGFDVRRYTNAKYKGDVSVKSLVCNRQGYRDMKRKLRFEATNHEAGNLSTAENKDRRIRQPKKHALTRCGYKAHMRLRTCEKTDDRPAVYIVDVFVDVHNHSLYSVKNREFQKLSRDVHDYIKRTTIDHTKLNIDFKNFKRNIKCFIGDKDAKMFIEHLKMLAETNGFYFAYDQDENRCLTKKMPEKVGRAICNDTEFMTDINAVVWDVDLEPEEFEQNWKTVIEAHGMESNWWLKYVFAIRQKWIPAYFRDLPLGCFLRTTQRSESSNSYFKRFESHFGTLVEFWMRYNSAIEQQRHSQRRWDTANEHSMLKKVESMKVEMHASLVYTHPIFADFQNEVKHAICSMGVGDLTRVGTVEYHDVRDGLKHRDFRVEFNIKTNESKCACKLFERHGIVCRHILWVWNGRQVHRIPETYVLARWTKKSYRPIVRDKNGKVIEDIDEADIKKAEMSKVWSEIYETVGVIDSYATEIEALLGITASNDIDLRPPNKAKNKGNGKRLRSSKEKAKTKQQKRKRRCGNCKKWVNHNSRTCNLPFAESPPSNDDDDEESETEEKRMSDVTDDNRRSLTREEIDEAKRTIESLTIEQLKEKKNRNYTEAEMDNQFIAGVNALKKYYTEVDISIFGDWTPVLKAMELMEAYKNPFQDESVEVESTLSRTVAQRVERIE
ncbi:protein FAR1-RELATED SEQUENCE 1-like [Silene latifolia]|uniref:protein FAR1-RELATED SEQUENCE 1-like n=1 Tax=Silene latifolia TaxID=37657 RepID=UPI003D77AEE5